MTKKLSLKETRAKAAAAKKDKKRRKQEDRVGISEPANEELNNLILLYQQGSLDDAEILAIYLSEKFPLNPLPWKLLGGIYKGTNRLSQSLNATQKSIALNPKDAEAQNNLGIVLQDLDRLDEAAFAYQKTISLKPNYPEAHYNLGNALQGLGKLQEAEKSYRAAIEFKEDYADAYYNLGVLLRNLGRLDQAETIFIRATECNPRDADAHGYLGITQQELGKLEAAELSYKTAIFLRPKSAVTRNNLGNTLKELGKLEEARQTYNEALELDSFYPELHYNYAVTLKELGFLESAEKSFTKAIELKPDYAESYNNLGVMFQDAGKLEQALESYLQALLVKPDLALGYLNLGSILRNFQFTQTNREIYPVLGNLLSAGNFAHPKHIVKSILSLLRHDPLVVKLLAMRLTESDLATANIVIESCEQLPLLHQIMRVCPLPDLEFEQIFVYTRRSLLLNLDDLETSSVLVNFLSTLSLQSFVNEYVYFESEAETLHVSNLEEKIVKTLERNEQPAIIDLLCFCTYRPIHACAWQDKLTVLNELPEVNCCLLQEPQDELEIAQKMPVLHDITNEVSLQVREQYEQNPYPRWIKLAIPYKTKSIAEFCDESKIYLYSESIRDEFSPNILIAGCGTGQHSIGTASRFSDCSVTAVDLSLSSLAYAERKTKELGLENVTYFQADILSLGKLDRKFDVIESAGVLHHMKEPMKGWKILVDLLKPDGLMKIGLYSELARSNIVKARGKIAFLELETSEAVIREFRQLMIESPNSEYKQLTEFSDFFSMSMLRDLIFHVQEHRFTLPIIQSYLGKLGLVFCGFENRELVTQFNDFHGDKADSLNLELWHQFEQSNPAAFASMYQFWCQKRN